MATDPYLQGGSDDFMVVCRPVLPMSVTYKVQFDPEPERWVLSQAIRVWSVERRGWDLEELLEFRFQSCDALMSVLRQLVEGAPGYFEVGGVPELQADLDRVTDR
jgi:hypothetical protein